jgi:hypothetical protein
MLVWSSSSPEVFNSFEYNTQLIIKVSGSDVYTKRTRFSNSQFTGRSLIVLTGIDHIGNEITEHIDIPDDDVYQTKQIYGSLTRVEHIGFDGDINIYLHASKYSEGVYDRYHLGITDEIEGPLYIRPETVDTDIGYITYYTKRFREGSNYRNGTDTVTNEEELWVSKLADANGNPIDVIDCVISPENFYLYTIDYDGFLHVYDHTLPVFSPPSLESSITLDTYIDIEALNQYVKKDYSMKLFTWNKFIRSPIVRVEIKRIAPDTTVEYLQADKTWDPAVYAFNGIYNDNIPPEETWNDIIFETTFDQIGQWEFYLTTTTVDGVSVAYTAVQCHEITALASIDTGIALPESIKWDHDGLTIADATNVYKVTEHADVYLLDGVSRRLYFREEYTSVEVTI